MIESGSKRLNDDVWVIVPCYNEGPVVRRVIQGVLEHFPNVVAVDDGSHDNSAVEIARTGARLVRHPVNMGAGAAYQTGIDFALKDTGAQIFVTFDADGQHLVEDVVAMVQHIREVDVEVLIGSRFLGSVDGMTRSRRALLRAAVIFERVTSGISLTDAHQGLRVFRRSFAQILDLKAHDMSWASEFLARMAQHQTTFTEFPVHVVYTDYSRSKGQKSINSVNIGIDVLINKVLRGR